jgi:hypothetical protein
MQTEVMKIINPEKPKKNNKVEDEEEERIPGREICHTFW